jgi:hypothetical protein
MSCNVNDHNFRQFKKSFRLFCTRCGESRNENDVHFDSHIANDRRSIANAETEIPQDFVDPDIDIAKKILEDRRTSNIATRALEIMQRYGVFGDEAESYLQHILEFGESFNFTIFEEQMAKLQQDREATATLSSTQDAFAELEPQETATDPTEEQTMPERRRRRRQR